MLSLIDSCSLMKGQKKNILINIYSNFGINKIIEIKENNIKPKKEKNKNKFIPEIKTSLAM